MGRGSLLFCPFCGLVPQAICSKTPYISHTMYGLCGSTVWQLYSHAAIQSYSRAGSLSCNGLQAVLHEAVQERPRFKRLGVLEILEAERPGGLCVFCISAFRLSISLSLISLYLRIPAFRKLLEIWKCRNVGI